MIFVTKFFDDKKEALLNQYTNADWIADSGLSPEALNEELLKIDEEYSDRALSLLKAKQFEFVLKNGQIAVEQDDIFHDKLNAVNLVRDAGAKYIWPSYPEEDRELFRSFSYAHAANFMHDFGHTSTNMEKLLKVGFIGIIEEVNDVENSKSGLTDEQKDFYLSVKTVYSALIDFCLRLAVAVNKTDPEGAAVLENIANGAPTTLREAMQLIELTFYIHEFIFGTRVRTLGRIDRMLMPFYEADLKRGVSAEELKEQVKYFIFKLWSMKVPYDLPLQIGGGDANGEVTNAFSYLFVKCYMELDIYSPKVHVRVSENTPKDFVLLVLSSIREGKSSFVFANDPVVSKSLMGVGIEESDAKDFTFIGCYEPAVYAHEIGCTGNGHLNCAKMVEYVFTRGFDHNTKNQVGIDTGVPESFEEFKDAVKSQIKNVVDISIDVITRCEQRYNKMYADPILSGMLPECVEEGADAFTGSAKYNSSSLYMHFVASLVDSLCGVKHLVFDEKLVTLERLGEILLADWEGEEELRQKALACPHKYGNDDPIADEIMMEFTNFFANLVTGHDNGRGGRFKASCFTIDNYVKDAPYVLASPDGRKNKEPLSKNLCATTGMDKNGITALINSVSKIDYTKFPNGSVLDFMLHPSAVQGEAGLEAFYNLVKTYFELGGMAVHGNVFDSRVLRAAQADPKKYSTLQVRVCGWNAYFVNLTLAEQNDFIKKCENL